MKVSVIYGTIHQGSTTFQKGEVLEIPDSKVSRYGDQVTEVVEAKSSSKKNTDTGEDSKST